MVDVGQRVVRVAGQPERQQVVGDAAQRRDALQVGDEPAVAPRHRLTRHQQAVHRDVDMAELTGHPGRATDHSTGLDHPAAEPGADDRRDRRTSRRLVAEVPLVGVQGRGVAVVVVDHREVQSFLDGVADVEAPPLGGGKVGGPASRDHAIGAGRPRRVEPDARTEARGMARHSEHELHRLVDRRRSLPPGLRGRSSALRPCRSTRNRPSSLRTVALVLVPPTSSPTTTAACAPDITPFWPRRAVPGAARPATMPNTAGNNAVRDRRSVSWASTPDPR